MADKKRVAVQIIQGIIHMFEPCLTEDEMIIALMAALAESVKQTKPDDYSDEQMNQRIFDLIQHGLEKVRQADDGPAVTTFIKESLMQEP